MDLSNHYYNVHMIKISVLIWKKEIFLSHTKFLKYLLALQIENAKVLLWENWKDFWHLKVKKVPYISTWPMDPLKHLGNKDSKMIFQRKICLCLCQDSFHCTALLSFLQSIWFFLLNFRKTVDQLAEVGFEMIFYSFGSGFNLEADDISGLKADIAYANSRGKSFLNGKISVYVKIWKN